MTLIFQCSAFKALKTTDDGKFPQTTPQWIEVKSHIQRGGYECGYYVMHWMWNIITGELKTDWSLWFGDGTLLDTKMITGLHKKWVPFDDFQLIIDEAVAKVVADLALKVADRKPSIEKYYGVGMSFSLSLLVYPDL
ncbi:hypothetical protein GmHk_15G044386 [Glycine max]|nr:hypothetical protein GmHk_15G044386 [Glycine max]KAH1209996.1 hypothetical protein GmHk_15G044386 [Glycine max]